jgi:predicted membrane metal-binding protein
VPYAVPAGQKAVKQVKQVFDERVAPRASAAVDSAMVASAPARREALRRSRLAASALRGDDAAIAIARGKRRWPLALAFLVLGGVAGAVAAWFSQAGKPVQLSPYSLPTDDDAVTTVDVTDDSAAPHAV